MNSPKRYPLPDQLRGLAVVLMVIFHFSYDLTMFSLIHIDFQKDFFWWLFPRIIVFLFLFAMGQSFYLAHSKGLRWKKFLSRLAIVAGAAGIISLATYILFPNRWIYFGTLHCIALCTLVAPLLIKGKYTGLLVFLSLYVPMLFGYRFWWWELDHLSMDYIPFLPWVGVVGLGAFFMRLPFAAKAAPLPAFIDHPMQLLGRHSLAVYLLHQPILFGLTYLMHLVSTSL